MTRTRGALKKKEGPGIPKTHPTVLFSFEFIKSMGNGGTTKNRNPACDEIATHSLSNKKVTN